MHPEMDTNWIFRSFIVHLIFDGFYNNMKREKKRIFETSELSRLILNLDTKEFLLLQLDPRNSPGLFISSMWLLLTEKYSNASISSYFECCLLPRYSFAVGVADILNTLSFSPFSWNIKTYRE